MVYIRNNEISFSRNEQKKMLCVGVVGCCCTAIVVILLHYTRSCLRTDIAIINGRTKSIYLLHGRLKIVNRKEKPCAICTPKRLVLTELPLKPSTIYMCVCVCI